MRITRRCCHRRPLYFCRLSHTQCCCCSWCFPCRRDQWNFTLLPTSRSQDPTGAYIKRWVPQLAGLPPAHIHTPWTAPAADLEAAGVVLGQNYPHRCDMFDGVKCVMEHDACVTGAVTGRGAADVLGVREVCTGGSGCCLACHACHAHSSSLSAHASRLCHPHQLLLCVLHGAIHACRIVTQELSQLRAANVAAIRAARAAGIASGALAADSRGYDMLPAPEVCVA